MLSGAGPGPLGTALTYSNFADTGGPRQAVMRQFGDFVESYTGFSVGALNVSGCSVHVPGATAGVAYMLCLNPLASDDIGGCIDGLASRPVIWCPDFRWLDADLLRWACGGQYAEHPLPLPPEERRFLPGVRLHRRRALIEARYTKVLPLSLARGGRAEAPATQVCIESRFGMHRVVLPCPGGGIPPGCSDLRPGSRSLLLLHRHGLAHAAIVAVLPLDRLAWALRNEVAA